MISPPSFTELYYSSIAEKRGYHKKRFRGFGPFFIVSRADSIV